MLASSPQQEGQRRRVPALQEAAAALPMLSLPDLEIILQILQEEKVLQDMENTPGSGRCKTASPTRHPYSGTTCAPDGTHDMSLDVMDFSMGEPELTSQQEVAVTSQPPGSLSVTF